MQGGSKKILIYISLFLVFNYCISFAQEKLSRHQTDSIAVKGKQEIKDKEWGDAIDTFGDLLDYEPDNLTANYYYAIGQRELGRSRNPLEHILRYNSAERHLNKIINIDSTFKDTYYQLAVLQYYRQNYFEAVKLAKHQLEMNDTLESALTGIFHLYDIMLENGINDKVEKYFKSNKTDYDKYFLGEFYRREGLPGKAETIFNELISKYTNMPLTPVYLSLVRLYVQENKYKKADSTYWKAVNTITNRAESKLLLYDFEYIINAREYKILYSPLSINKMKKVMKVFWMERNPLPSMSYNMRLIQHYRRLIYAEKNFRYDGLRLKIYNSDKQELIKHPPWYYLNDKFNDMGVIYIRFGEPDDIIAITEEGLVSRRAWLYEANNQHPRMIFYFKIDRNSPPNYWTLVPILLSGEYLKDLQIWDARFHEIEIQHPYTWYKYEDEGVKTAEKGLTIDSFTWPKEIKPLNARFTINQFRKDKLSNIFSLDYALPVNELTGESDHRESIPLKVEISIFDTLMNLVKRKVDSFKISTSDIHIYKNLYINGDNFILKRDKYILSMDIRIPGENKLFGSYFNFKLSDFNNELSCSSLEQAFKISSNGNNTISREHLKILPNPTLKYQNSENVFVYYEVYNLSLTNNKQTNYSVDFDISSEDTSKSIWDFFSGIFSKSSDYSISIQNSYKGLTKNVSNYIAFDIGKLEKGDYKMTITVKDKLNGKEASSSSKLIIQ
ncbi:MAG: GWxTD domain-containing protein [Ignavibacteriaceae bacterium]